MAESHSTLGNRFAGRKIFAKGYNAHSPESLKKSEAPETVSVNTTESVVVHGQASHSETPSFSRSALLDDILPELMETLRSHMNDLLRLPLSAQQRSRLVRNYWQVEFLVEEIRLFLDVEINP